MAVNEVRRNGSYAPLSARYYQDSAIAGLDERAELLYVRGLAFCADMLSDGFISDTQLVQFVGVKMRDVGSRAQRLGAAVTDNGDTLWKRDDERGGWWVTAWCKWNRSAAEIADKRRADAERKAGGRR